MSHVYILRDCYGKVLGKIDEFWNDEDQTYFDFKETNVRFPQHSGNLHGEVHIWNLNDK